ncbi:unnamed protein product [Scytosiphon promiscuus]
MASSVTATSKSYYGGGGDGTAQHSSKAAVSTRAVEAGEMGSPTPARRDVAVAAQGRTREGRLFWGSSGSDDPHLQPSQEERQRPPRRRYADLPGGEDEDDDRDEDGDGVESHHRDRLRQPSQSRRPSLSKDIVGGDDERTEAGREISDIDRRLGELHDFLRRAKEGGVGLGVAGASPAGAEAGPTGPARLAPPPPAPPVLPSSSLPPLSPSVSAEMEDRARARPSPSPSLSASSSCAPVAAKEECERPGEDGPLLGSATGRPALSTAVVAD